MDRSKMTTLATILLIGAAIGFVGGTWVGQRTHPNTAHVASDGETDLTDSVMLSNMAQIKRQYSRLESRLDARDVTGPVAAGN